MTSALNIIRELTDCIILRINIILPFTIFLKKKSYLFVRRNEKKSGKILLKLGEMRRNIKSYKK